MTTNPDDEYVYYYVIYPDGTDTGGSYDVIFSDINPEDYIEFKAEKIEKASGCFEDYFGEVFYVMPEAKYIDAYQYQDARFMGISYVVMDASNKFIYEIDGTPVYEQLEYTNDSGEVTQYEEIAGYEPGEIGLEVEKRLKDTGEKLLFICVLMEPDENYVMKAYRLYYYITGGRENVINNFVMEEIEALRNSLK